MSDEAVETHPSVMEEIKKRSSDINTELDILESVDEAGLDREVATRFVGYATYSTLRACAREKKMSDTKRARLLDLYERYEAGEPIPFDKSNGNGKLAKLQKCVRRLEKLSDEIEAELDGL